MHFLHIRKFYDKHFSVNQKFDFFQLSLRGQTLLFGKLSRFRKKNAPFVIFLFTFLECSETILTC